MLKFGGKRERWRNKEGGRPRPLGVLVVTTVDEGVHLP